MKIRIHIALAFTSVTIPSYAQVLAPPPLPEQSSIARTLKASLEANDANAYFSVLSDNLEVFEDGKLVAHSKSEWMDKFGKKMNTNGVRFRVSNGYQSTSRILFVEYFNTVASWPGSVPASCCWGYNVSAYDVKQGKVVKILCINGGEEIPGIGR